MANTPAVAAMGRWGRRAAAALCAVMGCISLASAAVEANPIRPPAGNRGPQASRLIVGFKQSEQFPIRQTVRRAAGGRALTATQAQTSPSDLDALVRRTHLSVARSRQVTPSMHVIYLARTLSGPEVAAALEALRADGAIGFAAVDERRQPHALPDDPLFLPSADASGQWFMLTPSAPGAAGDAAATDAVTAWSITTGSTGTVIADIDTGVRFEHPDLLRAGFSGRLLPGYDFVAEDVNSKTGAALGTYLIANDGDGWDPDPSDPGDWISTADQTNALFPAADCPVADSTWHGTRVMGLLGALTDNAVGIAGMTWAPHLLPVRPLGKCGGYDSDIIAGMQWAAGLPVNGVPDNPYPARIINLSVGSSGACPASYAAAVGQLSSLGVLVVASAGNAGGPVDAPGNCPGVLAVAGLRNVGTKVGYSSFGPQVGIAAPAGNCVNASGPCLRSIDTTTNSGLTAPAVSTYTNQVEPNLGTSFSAPLVSAVAALMFAVNDNLTPAQAIERIEGSASVFPQPAGLPVCPAVDAGTGECACPNDGTQCGAGMLDAYQAVLSALRPIAAVTAPRATAAGASAVLDASGSAAACGRSVQSIAWSTTGAVTLLTAPDAARVTVVPTGAGTVGLTVTDSAGAIDTVTLAVDAAGAISVPAAVPTVAGSAAGACPTALSVVPAPPTLAVTLTPATVAPNTAALLTLTLKNANPFALTQTALRASLPANLQVAGAAAAPAASTCGGASAALTNTSTSLSLVGAVIPAAGSCAVTVSVQGATPGTYRIAVAAQALASAPAGSNTEPASADLTITQPPGGGGGAPDGWDLLFVVGVLLAGRRHARRRR